MSALKEAAEDFLAQKRIAMAGVSRTEKDAANIVYRKLRASDYEVFPVNPKADEVEGDPCYHDLKSIPGEVDAVVAATPPEATEGLVRDCAELGIRRIWIHRAFGAGSVSQGAVDLGRERGMTVIDGACPMMFCRPVDFGHRCMRFFLGRRLPKEV